MKLLIVLLNNTGIIYNKELQIESSITGSGFMGYELSPDITDFLSTAPVNITDICVALDGSQLDITVALMKPGREDFAKRLMDRLTGKG